LNPVLNSSNHLSIFTAEPAVAGKLTPISWNCLF